VLDITLNDNDTVLLNDIYNPDAKFPVWDLLAVRDHETDRKIKELGYRAPASWVLTFEKLLSKTDFPRIVQQMLKKLEAAYKYPVDIEFTANFSNGSGFEINLLQRRPLQIFGKSVKHAAVKGITPDNTLFANKGSFMGSDILQAIKTVVYIRAEEYSKLSVTDKYEVARLVGKINRLFHDREKEPMMLIGPGRWGTSTPSLGVPVSFSEISNAAVLAEVASPKDGYMPEVSYGAHFSQDLVESKIFYIALFPGKDDTVFNPALLDQFSNLLFSIFPEYSRLQHAVKIYRPTELRKKLWLQARLQPRSSTSFFTGH
jgi:hypothetical protein